MEDWTQQLIPIIDEYRDGDTLDGDDVDRLCEIIKAKINFHQGNCTEEEMNQSIDHTVYN